MINYSCPDTLGDEERGEFLADIRAVDDDDPTLIAFTPTESAGVYAYAVTYETGDPEPVRGFVGFGAPPAVPGMTRKAITVYGETAAETAEKLNECGPLRG